MPFPSEEAFRQLFRDLSTAERLRFVAGLWAARGWETTVVNGVIIATSDGERQRLCVVDPGRFRTAVPDDADILVPVRERASLRTATERADIQYVPPAELRELLRYGVDRDIGAALFEKTFGQPVDAESHVAPPRSQQLRGAVLELRNRSYDRFGGSHIPVSVLVVVLLVSVAVAGPALISTDEEPTRVVETATPSPGEANEAAGPSGLGTDAQGEPVFPPGMVESGISDRSALIEAHQNAVRNRQRTLHVAAAGPPNATFMSGRLAWNYTMRAEGSLHYRVDANHTFPAEADTATAGPGTVRINLFSNGGVNYRRRVNATQTTYRRYPMADGDDASTFTDEVSGFLGTFLQGELTRVDCVDDTDYRGAHCSIIIRWAPPSFPAAEGYRASATIRPSGLVSSFSLSYTLPDTDNDGKRELVQFSFEYDTLDTTTVSEPEWLPEAKNGTSN